MKRSVQIMAEERSVFEVITDYAVNERIKILLLFEELNLDKEQRLIVDRLVSLHTESGALYGRVTYQSAVGTMVHKGNV